jgi:transcriptional regulator with XRE-family HTH domain
MKMSEFDLKKYREMLNKTQAQMAEITGTSQEQISRLEKDPSNMSMDFFFQLCAIANKSPNELISSCSVAGASVLPSITPFTIQNVYHEESLKAATLEHYVKPKMDELRGKQTYIDITALDKLDKLFQIVQTHASKPLLGFIGPSDAGKSTLINNLTGINALLADWTPTTSTTVFVKHIDDKPNWMKVEKYKDIKAMIFRAESEEQSWNYRNLYDRSYCESMMIEAGDYSLLEDYCNRDSKKRSKEVDSAIVFLKADILKACDLVDLPGFGTESLDETIKAQRIKEQADMIIFMSQSSGFLNTNDQVTFLKDTIQRIPSIDDVPLLANLMVVASQAHHISDRSKLNSRIRERLNEVINQLDEKVIRHSFRISKEELVEKLKGRFFTYSLDDAALRSDFEAEIKRVLIDVFPAVWKKRLNEEVLQFQKEASLYFEEEVKKAIAIQKHREKIRIEHEEAKRVMPERLKEVEASKEQILSYAEVCKSNDVNQFNLWESKTLNPEFIVELINNKEYNKKQAKEFIGSNLSDIYYANMQDIMKASTNEFNRQLNSFFESFERSMGDLSKITIDGTSIPFNFKGALAGGIAGASVLGGLGLWAATVGNLGGYILVAKGVSLLSALGISVGGTAAAASFVAAIGGPITIGIALAALAWLAVSSIFGDGWKKRLSKQVVKIFEEKKVASQYTDGIKKHWDDTKIAIEEVVASIIQQLKDYFEEREVLVNSTDPVLLEEHKNKASDMKNFFDKIPWNRE